MKRHFGFRSASELFDKLQADYQRLASDPLDSYAAYDFFVTAWHLVDWTHSPVHDSGGRDALLARAPVLRVCEQVAVGAKHVEPYATRYALASNAESATPWAPLTWPPSTWTGDLFIRFDGRARELYGDQLTVMQLAQLVIDVWRREFQSQARA